MYAFCSRYQLFVSGYRLDFTHQFSDALLPIQDPQLAGCVHGFTSDHDGDKATEHMNLRLGPSYFFMVQSYDRGTRGGVRSTRAE